MTPAKSLSCSLLSILGSCGAEGVYDMTVGVPMACAKLRQEHRRQLGWRVGVAVPERGMRRGVTVGVSACCWITGEGLRGPARRE